jgi:hypothetical protein
LEHPISESSLERFSKGTASKDESREIVAHLVKGCPACARRLRAYAPDPVPAGAYDAALDRLGEKSLDEMLEKEAASRRPGCAVLPWRLPGDSRSGRERKLS